MANETFAKAVVEVAAAEAGRMVDTMVREAPDILSQLDVTKAEDSARKILTQDRANVSFRIWSGVLGALTVVLIDPSVQLALTEFVSSRIPASYLPLVTAVLSSLLAFISKARDGRPVRSKP
jgi:hypothetical protein